MERILHHARLMPGEDLFSLAGLVLDCPGDVEIDWQEEDVLAIRDQLMKACRDQAADMRVSDETLNDILAWVDGEDDGYRKDNPFSFVNCVAPIAAGYGFDLAEALEAARDEFRRIVRRRQARRHAASAGAVTSDA